MSCFPPRILLREQTPAMEPGPVNIRICPPFMRTGILTGSLRGVCSFGETELIIHTANYSHYYGGIWYVPIIGDVDSINHLSAARMLLYGGFCAAALTLALFCMVYWKRRETDASAVTFYFGMISLSFALRICYPFFRLFGVPSVKILYAIEDGAALAGIYFTLQIVFLLVLTERFKRLQAVLRIISLGVCVLGVVLPLFVFTLFPAMVPLYGISLSRYKLVVAGLIIGLTVYGCLMGNPHSGTILAAACANGICLFYGVASIGRFEPLAGAWTEEYGAFCMVLAFAVLMVRRSRAMAAENIRLQLHLQEEVREKTQYLQELLVERGQLISELGHDMKSPLTSLSNMAQIIRLNDIMLDQDTRRRMLQIEEQCGISEENLLHIFRRSFTTRSDRGGQGLGLAITRDIILEHGGRTEVFCTHIISNILRWQSRKSSIVFPALRQEDRAEVTEPK